VIVDELIAILGFDLKGEGDLKRFKQGLDGAEKQATNFAAAFSKIGLAITGALAGLAIGNKIGDFIGDITRVNAEFESYEATLKTITGSSEQAAKSMDWISKFARETPYAASEVTEAFVRLKSYGIDPMDGTLRTVGDAASAMGKSMMSGVEAIADAVTGENERLKEFGITTKVTGDKITYNWKEDGKDLSKTVRKNATEIQKAVLGIMSRFDGAMDEQSKTWKGMTSNLAENWTDFLREIGRAGYFADVKRRLQGLLDFMAEGWSSGTFGRIAKRISDGLIGAMNTASHLGAQAYRIGRGFYFAADGVAELVSRMTGLSKGMATAGLAGGLLASSAFGRSAMVAIARRVPMVAAFLALDDIMSGLNGDDSLIGSTAEGQAALDGLKAKFAAAQHAIESFATSLGGLREKIVSSLGFPPEAFSTWDDATARWDGLKAEFSSPIIVAGINFGSVADGMTKVEGWAKSAADRIRLLFTDPVKLVQQLLIDAVDRVGMAFDLIGKVFTALASPIENIKSAIASVQAAVDALLASIDRIIPGAGATAQDGPKAAITSTGYAPQAASGQNAFTPDASLTKAGMETAEGLRVEKNVSEADTLAAASGIMNFLNTVSSMSAMAKVILDVTQFMTPANEAKAAMMDLGRTVMGKADLDISPLLSKIETAKAAMSDLRNSAGATVGKSVVPQRAAVVASPAS
jgi:hypothetical protein